MKDDSNRQDGQNPAPDSGREFAARRKIVKGMASAVPVVMTIGCGQAMANNSSLQCIKEPAVRPDECIDGTDGWVRRFVAAEDCTGQVAGSLTQEVDPLLSSSNTDSGTMAGRKGSPSTETTQPDTIAADVKSRLVYVNADGQETGNSADYPVTMSCYCSFPSMTGFDIVSEPETFTNDFGKKGKPSNLR
jgi:hypothetical protein